MPTPPGDKPRPPENAPRAARRHESAYIPLAPEDPSPQKVTTFPCPGCSRSLRSDSVICLNCGFDRKTGFRRVGAEPGKAKPIPCKNCGYDVTGVIARTCPECNEPIKAGRGSLLADERSILRATYRKAIIGIVVGLIGVGVVGGDVAVELIIATLLCWPVAIIGYAGSKLFWDSGIDEPWSILALRALAALTVATAIGTLLMPMTPDAAFRVGGLGRLAMMVFVVAATLMSACEEDVDDAFAYAFPFVVIGAFGPAIIASNL